MKSFFNVLFVVVLILVSSPATDAQQALELWYDQPADEWTSALPVGNGRLGAMVFGRVAKERIQLNEDTVWAGPPVPESNPGYRQAAKQARKLWFEGKYVESRCFGSEKHCSPHQPAQPSNAG